MNPFTLSSNQPQITRLQLSKFSHTTTTIDHSGPLLWNHINTTGDLACVLELFAGDSSIPARLIIRVVRNDGILEQLDLSHFARLLAAQGQPSLGGLSSKPPFAVVVRSPCLAVKYPHSNTHIRRFQIKFSQNTDYFAALSLLTQANCPFTEGSTAAQPTQRPPTSSTWSSSLQAPLTASNAASTTVTSENGTPVPFFPTSGYMSTEMTTMTPGLTTADGLRPLAPPPVRASGTMQSTRGRSSRGRGYRSGLGNQRSNQPVATSSSKQTATKKASTRPATAPAFHGQQLDEMLPPKRDLPFLKSSQKNSQRQGSEMSGVAPSTPLDRLPDHTSKSQAIVPTVEDDSMVIQDSQVSNSQSQSIVPTQPYPNPTLPTLPSSSQVPDTQLSGLPGFDPTMATQSQGGASAFGGEMIPMTQALDGVNNDRQGRTRAQGQGVRSMVVSEDQLASYLSAPTPERVAFLENWMCELLEDDKFLALCQDVESTWRRFAFGAKQN